MARGVICGSTIDWTGLLQLQPRVFIVEDEWILAVEAEQLVAQCGCAVIGLTGNVSTALDLVRHSALDGAILDINLGIELVWPVADLLEQHDVPFLFATAYGRADVPERFASRVMLTKPLALGRLRQALEEIGIICH